MLLYLRSKACLKICEKSLGALFRLEQFSFEDLRDKIIHYKEKHNINISFKKANECRELVEETISTTNKLVFR